MDNVTTQKQQIFYVLLLTNQFHAATSFLRS